MADVSASTVIKAPLGKVWDVFTDIPAAADRLSGLQKVEVLTGEPFGTGYRWRETRRLYGQSATEEMWVTAAADRRFYEVAANSHGSEYLSRYDFTEVADGVRVDVVFKVEPVSALAKALDLLTGWMSRGNIGKLLRQDLAELAAVCERP